MAYSGSQGRPHAHVACMHAYVEHVVHPTSHCGQRMQDGSRQSTTNSGVCVMVAAAAFGRVCDWWGSCGEACATVRVLPPPTTRACHNQAHMAAQRWLSLTSLEKRTTPTRPFACLPSSTQGPRLAWHGLQPSTCAPLPLPPAPWPFLAPVPQPPLTPPFPAPHPSLPSTPAILPTNAPSVPPGGPRTCIMSWVAAR